MKGARKFFYFFLGLLCFFMTGITIIVILLQYYIEINLPLTFFCTVSWALLMFAVFQTLAPEKETDSYEEDHLK
jgi:hypothetical protein